MVECVHDKDVVQVQILEESNKVKPLLLLGKGSRNKCSKKLKKS